MTTVCTRCKHFINKDPRSPWRDVWYNHLCGASPLPRKVDPYDGEEKPYGTNDLGQEVIRPDATYEFCQRVNDGDCQKYSPLSGPNLLPLKSPLADVGATVYHPHATKPR